MVVEAVVVGIDGTAPEAPGWVTITYQLSKTEHTTRDGRLEMARLENEAALGVNLAYPGAFRARLRAANGGTVIEATPPGIDGIFENLSDGEYLLEVEKDPDATFQPHVNDAMAQRMRDMGASAAVDGEDEDDDAFDTALAARMAAMAATENDVGCDDGVVEPLVEASLPPGDVADAPAGNDVEVVKDEWSRIPGRVTVKYNVEEGEYHTTDGVLSMREIDEDLAISFAFSGAFRARLKSNEFGHVLVASPTGIDGIFEGVFRGGYTLEIDEDPVVPIADSVAYVAPVAEETLGRRDDITAELRSMDADTLRAQGPEYQRLLAARDAEGVLSELAS